MIRSVWVESRLCGSRDALAESPAMKRSSSASSPVSCNGSHLAYIHEPMGIWLASSPRSNQVLVVSRGKSREGRRLVVLSFCPIHGSHQESANEMK